jgi:hypothetical protein
MRVVRDPCSGEVHLLKEQVAIMSVMRNPDRTLLKVRWQARGDCVVFLEDLGENHPRICGRLKEYSGFTLSFWWKGITDQEYPRLARIENVQV